MERQASYHDQSCGYVEPQDTCHYQSSSRSTFCMSVESEDIHSTFLHQTSRPKRPKRWKGDRKKTLPDGRLGLNRPNLGPNMEFYAPKVRVPQAVSMDQEPARTQRFLQDAPSWLCWGLCNLFQTLSQKV